MGAEIYETRADAFQGLGPNAKTQNPKPKTQQRSALHTKLIMIDRRYVLVGSLNLDPRSVVINIEIEVMIDSPELATELLEDVEDGFDRDVYRLALDTDGSLLWHGHYNGVAVELTRDPQSFPVLSHLCWLLGWTV